MVMPNALAVLRLMISSSLAWLLDRQIARLGTLQYLVYVPGGAALQGPRSSPRKRSAPVRRRGLSPFIESADQHGTGILAAPGCLARAPRADR